MNCDEKRTLDYYHYILSNSKLYNDSEFYKNPANVLCNFLIRITL